MIFTRMLSGEKIKLMWFSIIIFSVCAQAKSDIRPERLLLATQEWRPYQYRENGEMKGPGIERLQCVMKILEQPYQLTMTDWDRAQLLVEVGEQDGFFLASRNDFRSKYADFSTPIMDQVWSWFTLSKSSRVDGAVFKEETPVTALFGSSKWFWLHKKGYLVVKKPRKSSTLVELLLTGEVGAVLANDFVMQAAIKSSDVSNRTITRKVMKKQSLGVYFSKKFTKAYPQFMTEFNQAVAQCKEG